MTVDVVWKLLPLSTSELSLARVLRCGQTFRWKNVNNVWSFATSKQVILLKQDESQLHYASVPHNESEALAFINDYFNLGTSLTSLYKDWHAVEQRFRPGKETCFSKFPGIRILRQDPWETVVSFICSSNNNVKRISKMCESLCNEFGTKVAFHDGLTYNSFPQPEVLALDDVESRLRELGFGYRAKYIHQTAKLFTDGESGISLETLHKQRLALYEDAHDFLLQLVGVGPKVADCICLMALDKHDVVPIDTHVMQIATRDYKFKGPKTMSKAAYHDVRVYLKDLFGEYAGWAQLVMFAADLADLNNGVNEVNGKTIKHTVEKRVGEVESKTVKKIKVESKTVKKIKVVKIEEVSVKTG